MTFIMKRSKLNENCRQIIVVTILSALIYLSNLQLVRADVSTESLVVLTQIQIQSVQQTAYLKQVVRKLDVLEKRLKELETSIRHEDVSFPDTESK